MRVSTEGCDWRNSEATRFSVDSIVEITGAK